MPPEPKGNQAARESEEKQWIENLQGLVGDLDMAPNKRHVIGPDARRRGRRHAPAEDAAVLSIVERDGIIRLSDSARRAARPGDAGTRRRAAPERPASS